MLRGATARTTSDHVAVYGLLAPRPSCQEQVSAHIFVLSSGATLYNPPLRSLDYSSLSLGSLDPKDAEALNQQPEICDVLSECCLQGSSVFR